VALSFVTTCQVSLTMFDLAASADWPPVVQHSLRRSLKCRVFAPNTTGVAGGLQYSPLGVSTLKRSEVDTNAPVTLNAKPLSAEAS
jgi:hypothetical protein